MKGSENNILDFMSVGTRYYIPCYQRPYSWTEEQCRILFDDIVQIHEQHEHDPNSRASHFIGSIVCQQTMGDNSGYLIIDGQQRLTTMYLFYLALSRHAEERSQSNAATADAELKKKLSKLSQLISLRILEDESNETLDGSSHHRFELTKQDQEAMDKLYEGNPEAYIATSQLTKNYNHLYKLIGAEENLSLSELFRITKNVLFIEIKLDAYDDAQLIFESLNSKGLELSEGDKVRNYVLMGFNQNEIEHYYHEWWLPIERNCKNQASEFIQYYLAIKLGKSPSMKVLYVNFKNFVVASGLSKTDILKDLLAYSELFACIQNCSYELPANVDIELSSTERSSLQSEIEQSLRRLKYLKYTVRTPFIMQGMMLHKQKQISGHELLASLKIIETFLIRRWVCGVPSHGLNRLFQSLAGLSRNVSETAGLVPEGSFTANLMRVMGTNDNSSKMPKDDEFKQALLTRDLYTNKSRSAAALIYLMERLENAESREQIAIFEALEQQNAAYSVEHVMPQNLSKDWRAELGPDADKIHKTWLHRLANLTLTAYNSKYSNNSFAEKRSMEHGFGSSPLRLNQQIAKYEHWGPAEMEQRAADLVAKALRIWPYPQV